MQTIKTTEELAGLCQALADDTFVTVDTEFMREKTYWPELCLIQIAGSNRHGLIDPLANGIELQPFFDLMANENVIKVFHAARQDIEIIHMLAGIIPKPLFDTQIAAMVCGFGDQIGYEPLVRRLTGAQIDKSSRFTDWSRRPLSDKQLSYALSDVTHLRDIYVQLKKQLNTSGRESWLDEEMAILASKDTYCADPNNAWKRVKFRARKKRQLAILIELAAWREREAQKRNIPRNRILKDDALGELAVQTPTDAEAMSRLRAVPRGMANSQHAPEILAAIATGHAADLSKLPTIDNNRPIMPEGAGAIADMLKLTLKVVCEREGIAPKLIASSSDIDQIAAGQDDDIPALKGWRRQVFGNLALDIKAGKKAICLCNGGVEFVNPVAAEQPVTA